MAKTSTISSKRMTVPFITKQFVQRHKNHFLLVFSRDSIFSLIILPSGRLLNEGIINDLARYVLEIFVGAYDQEG